MSLEDQRRKVLELVADGNIPADDAAKLLTSLNKSGAGDDERALIVEALESEEINADDAVKLLAATSRLGGTPDERKLVLEKVRSGDLEPDDAIKLIHALGSTGAPEQVDEEGVDSVLVVGTFRTLRIEGDPSVRTAVADGLHKVRRKSGTMIFEEDPTDEDSWFTLFGPQRRRRVTISGRYRHGGGSRGDTPPVLHIRMNPDLPLEIDMTAGSARVRDVRGPIDATLAAGTARFEGVQSPFRASVDAGSLTVSGIFDRGESEVRCTAGKVRLELDRGSSVRIRARATLGKISLPGSGEGSGDWQGIGGGKREVTIGSGEGTLDIEATTGAVVVEVEE